MAKYLLIFKIVSSQILDYSRERIIECDALELPEKICELKEEFVKEATKQMCIFTNTLVDGEWELGLDERGVAANVELTQVLPL